MAGLQVSHDPNPIPWHIPREAGEGQTGPGRAEVHLLVYTVDTDSGQPIAGVFNLVDPISGDVSAATYQTNTPHQLLLFQVKDTLDPPDPITHQSLYLSPSVLVKAEGYDEISFDLL